jgi:hypothetical protein
MSPGRGRGRCSCSSRALPLAVILLILPRATPSERTFEIRDHLGTKGPYRVPADNAPPAPPAGCAAVFIAGVLRHGSRNPGKKDILNFDRLEAKGVLGFKNPYKLADSHLLVDAGAAEHFGIASRLKKRFAHLFEQYHSRRHHFRSSCHE